MSSEHTDQSGRTALLIVDMQNGFCHADGSFAQMGHDVTPFQEVIEPCRVLLQAARDAGLPIVFFRYTYQPGHTDNGTLFRHSIDEIRRTRSCEIGTWDAEIVEALTPRAGERVVDKNRPSGFFGNNLAAELHKDGVERVVICGVTTSCCVEGTVRDAGQHDFETIVVSDASGEMTQERHDAALHTLGFLFAEVLTTEEAVKVLASARQTEMAA